MDNIEDEIELEDIVRHCLACDDTFDFDGIPICANCLGAECDDFTNIVEDLNHDNA